SIGGVHLVTQTRKSLFPDSGCQLFICAEIFRPSLSARMESSERSSGNSERALPRVLTSASRFLLLLGGYFLLQIVLRLITSNTTDLDESEQLLATQQWQWGYGPQPPLYTWLLIPFVKTLGPGALALALLKDALWFGTYALTFASARLMLRDAARSALAALS